MKYIRGLRCLSVLAVTLSLAACGGGGNSGNASSSATSPAETLFVRDNAWIDTRPEDAETITAEAFRQGVASGELVVISSKRLADQRAARDQQMRADIAYLTALPNPGPALQVLLADAASNPAALGDVIIDVGHPVALLGLETRVREAVQTQARADSTANVLLVYTQAYDLLADAVKAQVPAPASLTDKTVAEIHTAIGAIDAALATLPSGLDTARPDLLSAPRTRAQAQAIGAGQGRDYDDVCSPTNYAGTQWFPLKNFVSPMKDQGTRGTCWAFTALGALESRERVQNNSPVDLSEQFLVNKVREDWDSDDDVEGFYPARALDLATDKNQVLPSEAAWTYNAAPNRVAGESDDFRGVCNPYANGPNGGTCSESSHESRRVCTTVGVEFCAYSRVSYTGAGVNSGHTALLWLSGDRFDLNLYRYLLSQGIVFMASTPVYRGLQEVSKDVTVPDGTYPNGQPKFKINGARGVVSNFDTTYKDDDGSIKAGAKGSHAMLVVGFLSNAELGPPGSPANIPGGGYFIIKNSWGCNAGDAGYYYVPAAYVEFRFSSLHVLNTDSRRSTAWLTEQALPDSLTPPSITLTGRNSADLRVPRDLAAFFKVTHPAAKAVRVTITSDVDGVVFDGSWDTDRNSISGTQAMFTATTVGDRNMTVVARYGSISSTATFPLYVYNSAPGITAFGSGLAYVGEPFSMTAQPTDINESDSRLLCNNMVWTVDAPDTVAGAGGCLQQINFTATGLRTVHLRTMDREGLAATADIQITVLPARANPYPRITRAEVLSREISGSAPFRFCRDTPVSMGATIDLTQSGCTASPNDIAPLRFTASVDVENPSAESITYAWDLIATVEGADSNLFNGPFATSSVVTLTSPGQITLAEHDCRVEVRIIVAADATRSKRQTVWAGRCAYLVGKLN